MKSYSSTEPHIRLNLSSIMAAVLQYTPVDTIEDTVEHLRRSFNSGISLPLAYRKKQLQQLYNLVTENEALLFAALHKDLRKHEVESIAGEIAPVADECLWFLENLDELAKDEKVKPRVFLNRLGGSTVIRKDPLGVVLIIGAWNYPIQLLLVPLVGAIAAGNTAVLKPSEVAAHTAAAITALLPNYLDPRCYRIVNGAVPETTKLLELHFNHIFYTGNPEVGKIVMSAAAKHLTSVTLELGGKSPAIITSDVDMQVVTNRIAFGKFYNAGQVCIAPDYVLIQREKLPEFVKAFKTTVQNFYGGHPEKDEGYARIISERQMDRLQKVLDNKSSGNVIIGGETNKSDLYFAPTVITDVDNSDPSLMGDEIFGPILPVVSVDNIDEAINIVNSREPPLVLYLFSKNRKTTEKVLSKTQSGGVLVNDTLMHQAEYSLPFGGTGRSGLGSYHGKKSFEAFTHERSVMIKSLALL
ncbi:Aldehyde/histidinol dehydrogenase [Umbelopsis sp. PMI_123]|nr:Aldehyde/histidinol dehydrogenase [Umbelopsis sp. PMI_123]